MTQLTVERLRKVEELICEEPKRMHMGSWVVDDLEDILNQELIPPCHTVACIAGWSLVQERIDNGYQFLATDRHRLDGISHGSIQIHALKYLQLTEEEGDSLFFGANWPGQFKVNLYYAKPQTPEYAAIVIERIEHFIATGGKE